MINEALRDEYFKSGIYSVALGAPIEALQYAMLHFAEVDNFEGAIGFQQAINKWINADLNCRVKVPEWMREMHEWQEHDEDEDEYKNEEE